MRTKNAILLATLIVAVFMLASLAPIAQPISYHQFADQRTLLGIPNAWNVTSNLPFAVVGVSGLTWLARANRTSIFRHREDILPYAVFFIGVALVSVGSAYYHLAPDNARLVWDRLPMAIAFMGLFAGVIADRIDVRIGNLVALPTLVTAGLLSVIYWHWSELHGHGDLRPYFLVQFYPMAAIPLICWLYPKGRYIDGRFVVGIFATYAIAKLLELYDDAVFRFLGASVSGHSLKHLAAALAPLIVLAMLRTASTTTNLPIDQMSNQKLQAGA
jgi:hypothetical protein